MDIVRQWRALFATLGLLAISARGINPVVTWKRLPEPPDPLDSMEVAHARADVLKQELHDKARRHVGVQVALNDALLGLGALAIAAGASGAHRGAAMACVVQGDNDHLFVIVPVHVVSPYPPLNGRGIAEENAEQFRVIYTGIPTDCLHCLEGTGYGGRLAPCPISSFDVQFALVTDVNRVRAAFAGIGWSIDHPSAVDLLDLFAPMHGDLQLEILVPSNHRNRLGQADTEVLLAEISTYCEDCPLTYVFESGTSKLVLHSALELQLDAGQATLAGRQQPSCPASTRRLCFRRHAHRRQRQGGYGLGHPGLGAYRPRALRVC